MDALLFLAVFIFERSHFIFSAFRHMIGIYAMLVTRDDD